MIIITIAITLITGMILDTVLLNKEHKALMNTINEAFDKMSNNK